jgi:hypothetical protein
VEFALTRKEGLQDLVIDHPTRNKKRAAIVVLASWIAHEVEERVLAGVMGVNDQSRVRLLKLAVNHRNAFPPRGWAAESKGTGRYIGEDNQNSVVGRVLNADRILRCVARHEVARVDLAVRETLHIIQARDLILNDPQVAGPERLSGKEVFPFLSVICNACTHFEVLKTLTDPFRVGFAELSRSSHRIKRDTGGRSSKNMVHRGAIPVLMLCLDQAQGDFLCRQRPRFVKPRERRGARERGDGVPKGVLCHRVGILDLRTRGRVVIGPRRAVGRAGPPSGRLRGIGAAPLRRRIACRQGGSGGRWSAVLHDHCERCRGRVHLLRSHRAAIIAEVGARDEKAAGSARIPVAKGVDIRVRVPVTESGPVNQSVLGWAGFVA